MQNLQNQNELRKLEKILISLQTDISQAKHTLSQLLKEADTDQYRDIPGVEGTFDGVFMNTSDGQKIEVPPNYAAKSRLVYGDTLKMVKVREEGQEEKTLFKQVVKVPRKRIEGVMSKKDGKWYLLTESNSYRILDRAAEFNGALQNDIAFGLIPEGIMAVPFASLDSIKRVDKPPIPIIYTPASSAPKMALSKPAVRSPKRVEAKEFISELKPVEKKPAVTTLPVEEDDLR